MPIIDKDKLTSLQSLVDLSEKIVVIVPNNIDGDSLASAIALENIFGQLGKDVVVHCAVNIPEYLHFVVGWDRVISDWPANCQLAIMVDNSTIELLDVADGGLILKQKLAKGMKLAIIDHHQNTKTIQQADLVINQPEAVATGQLIHEIATSLGWPIDLDVADSLAISILSDSLGFTSQGMINNYQPLQTMAELVKLGVNLADINNRRLSYNKISHEIVFYKGQLLQRIDWLADGQIAILVIENDEIKRHSHRYNPNTVLDEMRFVDGVRLSIGFKKYQNSTQSIHRVTVRIRCHGRKTPVADQLATDFGGGGHAYAAGIKFVGEGLDFAKIKHSVCQKAISLLKQNPS